MNFREIYGNNKRKIFFSAIIVLAFVLGYTLPSVRASKSVSENNNISIKPFEQQKTEPQEKPKATKKPNPNTKTDPNCAIKGKTTTKGVKQYYMPGSMYYAKTKAEKCFTTEAEAQAAGYIKSKR